MMPDEIATDKHRWTRICKEDIDLIDADLPSAIIGCAMDVSNELGGCAS